MSDEATVNLADVFRNATRIPRTDLQVGDTVFDVWGDRYYVMKVRHFKAHTRGTREDGETFFLVDDETITVIKRGTDQ